MKELFHTDFSFPLPHLSFHFAFQNPSTESQEEGRSNLASSVQSPRLWQAGVTEGRMFRQSQQCKGFKASPSYSVIKFQKRGDSLSPLPFDMLDFFGRDFVFKFPPPLIEEGSK